MNVTCFVCCLTYTHLVQELSVPYEMCGFVTMLTHCHLGPNPEPVKSNSHCQNTFLVGQFQYYHPVFNHCHIKPFMHVQYRPVSIIHIEVTQFPNQMAESTVPQIVSFTRPHLVAV